MLYFGEYVFDLVSSFSFLHDYRSSIFQSHARYALCKYLNPLWQRLSQGDVRNNLQDGGEKLIVIVDNRPSASLRFCVLNSLLMTGLSIGVLCMLMARLVERWAPSFLIFLIL
jgi:hypothetical protein